jgi:PD-(D/E)XK nuclease superfamily
MVGTLGELLAGPLARPPADGIATLRAGLDHAARTATAIGAWSPEEPLRLSKHLVTGLLRCPRRALAEHDGTSGGVPAGAGDDVVVGWIVDAAAKLAVVSPRRRIDVSAAVAFCTALGDTTVADRLADLGADASRLEAEAGARIERLTASGIAGIDAGWWPRVEEPVRATLADGTVTVAGRLDVLLGGPPTGRPAVVVEVKGGRWYDGMRADGHLYALMVALRDGEVPAAAVTVVSDGTTQIEPIRPALLQHAAERLDEVMGIAAGLAAGEPPRAAPGVHCQHCPVRGDCPAAEGRPAAVEDTAHAPQQPVAREDRCGGHHLGVDDIAIVPRHPVPREAGCGGHHLGVDDIDHAQPQPVRRPGLADPVGSAERLRSRVTARLADVVTGAAAPVDDVYVGWLAAQDAAACPARYRAEGEGGWGFPGWSPPLAAAACARAALAHNIACADAAGGGWGAPPPPVPLDTIRAWMQSLRKPAPPAPPPIERSSHAAPPATPPVERSSVGDWICETWEAGDTATLAAVAATAGRWLAGFLRVLGWPLPPHLTLLGAPGPTAASSPSWRPDKHSPVTVASGADARIGRVTGSGGFGLVVHRAATRDDGSLRDRAAFEAAAGALAIGVAPAHVLVTAGDAGERVTIPVDDDLLARGAERIVGVAVQRAVAVERGFDAADARPSPGCRHCDHRRGCPPGESWVRGPGRWRGGLPVLPIG